MFYLNVILKITLVNLSLEGVGMRPVTLIVKEFDGPRRAVIGEVDLPITISLTIFTITF